LRCWLLPTANEPATVLADIDENADGVIQESEIKGRLRAERTARRFKRFDTNGNGKVTAVELFAYAYQDRKEIIGVFAAADTDGDKGLDADEFALYLGSLPKNEARLNADASNIFGAQDKDSSGNLSQSEFRWSVKFDEL
jgi:Ca2+-binding EF-hand superfamily protein